jgi:hypothetical protein
MREAARAAPLAIVARPSLMRHLERLIAAIPRLPALALSPAGTCQIRQK